MQCVVWSVLQGVQDFLRIYFFLFGDLDDEGYHYYTPHHKYSNKLELVWCLVHLFSLVDFCWDFSSEFCNLLDRSFPLQHSWIHT